MTITRLLPAAAALLCLAVPTPAAAQIERRLERSFTVSPGHTVSVKLSGGGITTTTGTGNTVQVTINYAVDVSSERDADDILSDFEISANQLGDRIEVFGRRRMNASRRYRDRNRNVRISANVVMPAGVVADLDTSGGSITVRGNRTAFTKADTSGGSISVDGGSGALDLDTSGGSIRVGQALSSLKADTSGGQISVDYVGPTATDVNLDTSGGGITVGVDRAAKLEIIAGTSGGSVNIDGLSLNNAEFRRSRASGTMNGGGGRLTADTSGGSITISAARADLSRTPRPSPRRFNDDN